MTEFNKRAILPRTKETSNDLYTRPIKHTITKDRRASLLVRCRGKSSGLNEMNEAGSALGQGQPNGSSQPKSEGRFGVTFVKFYNTLE